MVETMNRPLRVFLCHASQDKPAVRRLYKRLKGEGWIDPWLDEEKLLPGQDWDLEIYKAIRDADAIIVCLSKESVAKEGYVQKEFKRALSLAEEKPEGTIYMIPLRLDECTPPVKFQQWQWVNYFEEGAKEKLIKALGVRYEGLELKAESTKSAATEVGQRKPVVRKTKSIPGEELDLYRFIQIRSRAIPEPFWIGKYPVTNAQYGRFLKADDYANPDYWTGFPKFDEECKPIGDWEEEGFSWLKEQLKDYEYFPPEMWKVEPRFWNHPIFGIAKPDHPVVGINWYEANAYCKWLHANWDELPEGHATPDLKPAIVRLPLATEWMAAAGGDKPEGRYPWDLPGQATTDEKEILKRANVAKKGGHTTPVSAYPEGKSPFGVMDMAGNVWEWQSNYFNLKEGWLALRGGAWYDDHDYARVSIRHYLHPSNRGIGIGFRVVAFSR